MSTRLLKEEILSFCYNYIWHCMVVFRAEMLVISGCTHPTVMKDMCAECGADLREYVIGQESLSFIV